MRFPGTPRMCIGWNHSVEGCDTHHHLIPPEVNANLPFSLASLSLYTRQPCWHRIYACAAKTAQNAHFTSMSCRLEYSLGPDRRPRWAEWSIRSLEVRSENSEIVVLNANFHFFSLLMIVWLWLLALKNNLRFWSICLPARMHGVRAFSTTFSEWEGKDFLSKGNVGAAWKLSLNLRNRERSF